MINPFFELEKKLIDIETLVISLHEKILSPPPTIGSTKKLYSIKDLADYLQVSTTTAQSYKNNGLPCIQYGRKVIFDSDEVLLWLNSKSKKGGRK